MRTNDSTIQIIPSETIREYVRDLGFDFYVEYPLWIFTPMEILYVWKLYTYENSICMRKSIHSLFAWE